tara:strand:+ start:593 stop:886 length:294 start_codon:yes stop_codon:yes gene_type:complete
MKTIVNKNSKVSVYIFPDDTDVTLEENQITTPDFAIGDMNSTDSELVEDIVDPPADWIGHKYVYDGKWSRSAYWQDIRDIEITELKKRIEHLEKTIK